MILALKNWLYFFGGHPVQKALYWGRKRI